MALAGSASAQALDGAEPPGDKPTDADLCAQLAMQPGGPGTVTWLRPSGPGDELCGPVNLRIGTSNPAMAVQFWYREEGGHGCPGYAEHQCPGVPTQGAQNGLTTYTLLWNSALDHDGHNGAQWVMIAKIKWTMQQQVWNCYEQAATVHNPEILTQTSSHDLPGAPERSGLFWIDPEAPVGSGREAVTLSWTSDFAEPEDPRDDPTMDLFVYDAVSGQQVFRRTVSENGGSLPASGSFVWDGWRWPDADKVPFGVYYYELSFAEYDWTSWTFSRYLGLGGVEVVPGVGGANGIAAALHWSPADADAVAPTACQALVYNLSPAADGGCEGVGSFTLPLGLGAQDQTVTLPVLEGSPHYVVFLATDGHGSMPIPKGERSHRNLLAAPVAVKVTTQVTEVWPSTDGPIFMSDHIGSFVPSSTAPAEYGLPPNYVHDAGYATSPPIYEKDAAGQALHCQPAMENPANGPGTHGANTRDLARIQAFTTLTCEDRVAGNGTTTENLQCGGQEVWFWVRDPDSNTLWDATGDTDSGATPLLDESATDNVATTGDPPQRYLATVVPNSAVSVPRDMNANPTDADVQAVVDAILRFGDDQGGGDQGGDNYQVVASPNPCPANVVMPTVVNGVPTLGQNQIDLNAYVPPGGDTSGVLEQWRLMYYERDYAPLDWDLGGPALNNVWDIATAGVGAGSTEVLVSGDASALVGASVYLMDDSYQNEGDTYPVTAASVSQGPPAQSTLTLGTPTRRPFTGKPGAFVDGQVVRTGTPLVRILPETAEALCAALAHAYDYGFAAFVPHPGEMGGHFAPAITWEWGTPPPPGPPTSHVLAFASYLVYFAHAAEPNVLHLVETWDAIPDGVDGMTHPPTRQTAIMVRTIIDYATEHHISADDLAVCTLVHELGHHFGMLDWDRHPDHANVDGSDGCVMLYDTGAVPPPGHPNLPDAIGLFGGPDAPPDEPVDYRDDIGSRVDPAQ